MTLCNEPLIGVVLVNPNGTIDVAYYVVSSIYFPSVQAVLDSLMSVLGYAGVDIAGDATVHHYEDRCVALASSKRS